MNSSVFVVPPALILVLKTQLLWKPMRKVFIFRLSTGINVVIAENAITYARRSEKE
jgi:hypothetical protein